MEQWLVGVITLQRGEMNLEAPLATVIEQSQMHRGKTNLDF